MVTNWAAEFRRGSESVEDYEQSGHPKKATTDENIEPVHSLIMCDKMRSLHDIARQIGISIWAVKPILTDILGMPKVSARWLCKCWPKIRRRVGLMVLSISCSSRKMTLRNLCIELWPKISWSFWSWGQKAEYARKHHGSTLLWN